MATPRPQTYLEALEANGPLVAEAWTQAIADMWAEICEPFKFDPPVNRYFVSDVLCLAYPKIALRLKSLRKREVLGVDLGVLCGIVVKALGNVLTKKELPPPTELTLFCVLVSCAEKFGYGMLFDAGERNAIVAEISGWELKNQQDGTRVWSRTVT